jgi:hypothetical protein
MHMYGGYAIVYVSSEGLGGVCVTRRQYIIAQLEYSVVQYYMMYEYEYKV